MFVVVLRDVLMPKQLGFVCLFVSIKPYFCDLGLKKGNIQVKFLMAVYVSVVLNLSSLLIFVGFWICRRTAFISLLGFWDTFFPHFKLTSYCISAFGQDKNEPFLF